jgi:tetratricopeptide (TPR) repeat protein
MDKAIFFEWKEAMESENLEKALEVLETEYHLHPDDLQCLYHIGYTWRLAGDLEKAKEFYLKVLNIDSEYEHANFGLGIIHQLKGEYEKAIEYLRKAANKNPYFLNAINSLGLTYKLNGDIDKAIEVYLKGINCLFRDIYNKLSDLNETKYVEHTDYKSDKWVTYAMETILNEAAREGLNSIMIPTPETALKFFNEKIESTCWVDIDGKRQVTPNYIESVREMLLTDIIYSSLTNNFEVAYGDNGEIEEAAKWFIESIAFIPEGYNYPNPFMGLKNLELKS